MHLDQLHSQLETPHTWCGHPLQQCGVEFDLYSLSANSGHMLPMNENLGN